MLPRVNLPGLLLEVDAQAGFAAGLTHLAETGTWMEDLAVKMCAVLVAEACNIGFTPGGQARRPGADPGPALPHRPELRPRRQGHAPWRVSSWS